ncbi:hypothetical protein MHYP_G00119290 [Metynnis hypsauchen]
MRRGLPPTLFCAWRRSPRQAWGSVAPAMGRASVGPSTTETMPNLSLHAGGEDLPSSCLETILQWHLSPCSSLALLTVVNIHNSCLISMQNGRQDDLATCQCQLV